MMEQQLQLAYDGNPLSLPLADHPDDMIVLEDTGETITRQYAHLSGDGTWHSSPESAEEHYQETWLETIEDFIRQSEGWAEEYVKSDDYGGDYAYQMNESDRPLDCVSKWITDQMIGLGCRLTDELAELMTEDLIEVAEGETCYEYSCSSSLCLDSFHAGEYEYQIEWSRFVEWCEDEDRSVPSMEFVNGTDCFHGDFNGKYPASYIITNTGIRWDYVCTEGQFETALVSRIAELKPKTTDEILRYIRTTNDVRFSDTGCDTFKVILYGGVANKEGSLSAENVEALLLRIKQGCKSFRCGEYNVNVIGQFINIGCQRFSMEQAEQLRIHLYGGEL